jgi:hypothetical protein
LVLKELKLEVACPSRGFREGQGIPCFQIKPAVVCAAR